MTSSRAGGKGYREREEMCICIIDPKTLSSLHLNEMQRERQTERVP